MGLQFSVESSTTVRNGDNVVCAYARVCVRVDVRVCVSLRMFCSAESLLNQLPKTELDEFRSLSARRGRAAPTTAQRPAPAW